MATALKPLPAWTGLDERKAERWPMSWATSFSSALDATPTEARIADLSTHGCRLDVAGGIAVGRYIRVALPHRIAAEGWVAWTRGQLAGVDFANPLSPCLVRQIVGGTVPAEARAA